MRTILIVDDEPAARYGLRRALESQYRVAEAESARFRAVLNQAGLPYIVEEHESGTWFVVRRADRIRHEELWPGVLDQPDKGRSSWVGKPGIPSAPPMARHTFAT